MDNPSKKHHVWSLYSVCFISPFILQTCYLALAPILFEVSNQSKPHVRDSLVLKDILQWRQFLFYNAFLSTENTWMDLPRRQQPHWWGNREWGCCLGARQTAQLPLITPWRQQRSLYPSQLHHVLNYKRFILVIKIYSILLFTGLLTEISRESWTEGFKPRVSSLKCSKDHQFKWTYIIPTENINFSSGKS